VAQHSLAILGWLALLGAAVAAVEMVYFWQLSSSWGTLMSWGRWGTVDVAAAHSWWAVGAVAAMGAALVWLGRSVRGGRS
jgi:hypothetical protein